MKHYWAAQEEEAARKAMQTMQAALTSARDEWQNVLPPSKHLHRGSLYALQSSIPWGCEKTSALL